MIFSDFLSGCDGDFMKTLEDELARVDDHPLLSVDTKIKTEVTSQPQVSPSYNPIGNPMVSQYTHRAQTKAQPITTPQAKSSPVQGVYAREESYNLKLNDGAPLPDVTQHGRKRIPAQAPMLVQQVVQSPLYVNLAPNVQPIPDGRASLMQLDGPTQMKQPAKVKPPSQPLLLQNNTKGVTPLILKTSDASFSPVVLQSNIINPETQTFMYTSAPVQGKFLHDSFK